MGHCLQAGVPAQILLATGTDQYRKPDKGMWEYFVEHGNEGKEPGICHDSTQAIRGLCTCMLPLLGSPLYCSHPPHAGLYPVCILCHRKPGLLMLKNSQSADVKELSVCLTCIEVFSVYSIVALGLQIMRRASLLGMQLAGLGTLQTATSKAQADWQLYPASSQYLCVMQTFAPSDHDNLLSPVTCLDTVSNK